MSVELNPSVELNSRYDLPTAVTFFLAGLGAGSLLALIFSPARSLLDVFARPMVGGKGQSGAL
jgi:hypothetical protein